MPRKVESGCCWHDACAKFDADGKMTYHAKSPNNNIYTYVDQPFLDPVLDAAVAKTQKFYSQTFFKNGKALACCFAAMILVMCGENIDRICWTLGPGGVGQSLFTAHIAAVFKGLHAYLDTNVLFVDEEMRKQAESLIGKLILTLQEAVENASKGMRQDLYKKLGSADAIAARLPYAIITRMIEIHGWTRFELNRLLRFLRVTEETFPSIFRRSWCCALHGSFLSEDAVARIPDAELKGVFVRDPTLKEFLKSGPCVATTWRILHGFRKRHTNVSARALIEDYANGADGGLTKRLMRVACGLPEQEPLAKEGIESENVVAAAGAMGGEAVAASVSTFDPARAERAELRKVSDAFA